MANPTDPILNVPTNSYNYPIEQVPFTKTPIPYEDILPTPQAPRNPYFPDNVPPTLAYLHADNPNSKVSQTLQTDGNHNLKVALAGGGGFASAAYIPNVAASGAIGPDATQGWGPMGFEPVTCNYIFGAAAALSVGLGNTQPGIITLLLVADIDDSHDVPLYLAQIQVASDGKTFESQAVNYSFYPAIDVVKTFGTDTIYFSHLLEGTAGMRANGNAFILVG